MAVLRRNVVPLRVLEPWIARLAAAAGARASYDDRDPYLERRQRRGVPARAATCSSRSRREPPDVRSDLLLVLVDALRATNPHYLQAADSRAEYLL